MAFQTLAELVKINDENLSGGVADELLQDSPLVRAMAAVPSSNGTDHHWLRYTTAPTAGFRNVNDGIVETASSDTLVSIALSILDSSFATDIQLARGYNGGVEAYLQREAMRHLRSAFQVLEQSVIYGDPGNFVGMFDQAELASLSGSMVVDGGGSNNLTSVILLNSSDPLTSAAIVTGNDGNISLDPSVVQRLQGSTGHYGAYFTNVSSWYGYQHASTFSAARIANVDSTGTSLDDDMIANAIKLFPAQSRPNMIAMNRDAQAQLRNSRTATTTTGAPAPFPSEVFGLPIVVTDQISSDETALV